MELSTGVVEALGSEAWLMAKMCKCGRPSHPKYDLCPRCYYAQFKWYAFTGYWEMVTRSDGDTDTGESVAGYGRGASLGHVLSKYRTRLRWIVTDKHVAFDTEKEAKAWLEDFI